jgi:hypothetical protein
MKMRRGIAMGKVRTWGCALVVFGSLVLFTSAALAQTCTPVVYVFRHAEDTNPPGSHPPVPIFALTPAGQKHAELYPTMVSAFEAADPKKPLCKVAKVYATTIKDKVDCKQDCKSATNAFCTARPLACAVITGDAYKCTHSNLANPIFCPRDTDYLPITQVGSYQLYEYLGNGNAVPPHPDYSTPVAIALRKDLLDTAKASQSSAIFWTSQGMHVLGGVIIAAAKGSPGSNIPEKTSPAIPPRNSVYLFEAVGSGSDLKFSDTPLVPEEKRLDLRFSYYVQCYNHVEASSQFPPPAPKFIEPYYCGFDTAQSNLGGSPEKSCGVNYQCGTIPIRDLSRVEGKICDTTKLVEDTKGAQIFGACLH